MDPKIIDKLLELNHSFYQNFSVQFSNTRGRLQPGVRRILNQLPQDIIILDLGSGNGELWNVLSRGGFMGLYIGLDSSPGLIEICRSRTYPFFQPLFITDDRDFVLEKTDLSNKPQAIFIQADLSDSHWDSCLDNVLFEYIFAFAILHHLPGHDLRLNTLKKLSRLLADEGMFVHSEWQFLNSPRLRARIQSWEKVGLTEDQVDKGDYLLDWRSGGFGLRYIHHFNTDELNNLSKSSGFKIINEFYSDGENGKLGYYQIWKKSI